VAEITTPAYKGPFARAVVARKKQVDGVMQRGLLVKRVMHAVAVETTTHPVGARHVKNNMAPALLSSHCPPVVHELHMRLQNESRSSQHSGFVAVRASVAVSCCKTELMDCRPAYRRPRGSQ
jgi:hypothetical protein